MKRLDFPVLYLKSIFDMFDYCLFSQIILFLVHYMDICEVGFIALSHGILCSVFVEVCLGTFIGSEF